MKIENLSNGYPETRSHRKENKQKENSIDAINNVFHKNSINIIQPNNCLDKNNRPKCDSCLKLCDFDWYVKKQRLNKKDIGLVCVNCFESKYAKDQSNEFEQANFYNIINQNECNLYLNSQLFTK